ncbi:MAG TPA: hypothetical protein VFX30_03470 [bacterium]|nr:hypothetical protein [bacterium]
MSVAFFYDAADFAFLPKPFMTYLIPPQLGLACLLSRSSDLLAGGHAIEDVQRQMAEVVVSLRSVEIGSYNPILEQFPTTST